MSTKHLICKSCGEVMDPYKEYCFRPRYGPPRYCSMKCRLISQALIYFIVAILFLIAIGIGFIASFANLQTTYSDAKTFFIFMGSFSLFFALLSAIGFRLRRTADYE
ncbi:MAG: hypothetical protein H7645_11345 [Candidatus Heimdallarchaeota archaeon]|nr:hypothetical protein [Candidatus Heimdallarchaeota archaeon]MCK4770919.1 hypothetical protein [Candidatus Heimdallarchaeota archaeon]